MKPLHLGVATLLAATCVAWPGPSAEASPHRTDKIVFVWANSEFAGQKIGLIDTDGAHRRLITHGAARDLAPAWSPDARRIAFTSDRSKPAGGPEEFDRHYSELYVMNADGSHVRRITRNVNQVDYEAAWSPDGKKVVLARGTSELPPPGRLTQPTDLWIIDLASGHERRLTNSPSTWEGWPHWSPDGRRIAFEGNLAEAGNDDVYTIGVDGHGLRRLTTSPGFDGDVRYAPDGKSLVFDSDRTGNSDLFLMRTDGTHVRQLTEDPSFDFSGSFSPDGRSIAFSSDRDGLDDIFRMRADGTHQTNLTQTPDEFEFDAEWQTR
jgi:Tol biopolymer transport system component